MLDKNPYAVYDPEKSVDETDYQKTLRFKKEADLKRIQLAQKLEQQKNSARWVPTPNKHRSAYSSSSEYMDKMRKKDPHGLREKAKTAWLQLPPDDPKRIRYGHFESFFETFQQHYEAQLATKKAEREERLSNKEFSKFDTVHKRVSELLFPGSHVQNLLLISDKIATIWHFKTRVMKGERRNLIKLYDQFVSTGEEEHMHKAAMLPRDSSKVCKPKPNKGSLRKQKPIPNINFTPNPIRDYDREKKDRVAFYKTEAWRRLRFRALELYGCKCGACGRKPPEVVLHVDHIKPRSKYPKLELDITNLQILCEDCNVGKSNLSETDFRQKPLDILN